MKPKRQPDLFDFDDPLVRMSRRDHPETSREAAESILSSLGALHALVLNAFEEVGPKGMTDVDLDQRLSGGRTYRPRRIELTRDGLIVDSGRVALNKDSKRYATVWVAKKFME